MLHATTGKFSRQLRLFPHISTLDRLYETQTRESALRAHLYPCIANQQSLNVSLDYKSRIALIAHAGTSAPSTLIVSITDSRRVITSFTACFRNDPGAIILAPARGKVFPLSVHDRIGAVVRCSNGRTRFHCLTQNRATG